MENAALFFKPDEGRFTHHNNYVLCSILSNTPFIKVSIIVPKLNNKVIKHKFKLIFSKALKTSKYSISLPPNQSIMFGLIYQSPASNYKTTEHQFTIKDITYYYTHISFDLNINFNVIGGYYHPNHFYQLSIKTNNGKIYPKMMIQFEKLFELHYLFGTPYPLLFEVNQYKVFRILHSLGRNNKNSLIIYCESVRQRKCLDIQIVNQIEALYGNRNIEESFKEIAKHLTFSENDMSRILASDPLFNLYVIRQKTGTFVKYQYYNNAFMAFFDWIFREYKNIAECACSLISEDSQRQAIDHYMIFGFPRFDVDNFNVETFVMLVTNTLSSGK